jgi:hypothetical protein
VPIIPRRRWLSPIGPIPICLKGSWLLRQLASASSAAVLVTQLGLASFERSDPLHARIFGIALGEAALNHGSDATATKAAPASLRPDLIGGGEPDQDAPSAWQRAGALSD